MSDVKPTQTLHADRPAAALGQVLPDRKELAAIAVERTRMPMVITDPRLPENPIVLANEAFLKLTGYSAEEVLGRNCRFLQGEGTASEAVAEIRRAVVEERNLEIEILNYRKDGSAFWNRLGLSPVHDENGILIYFFASQMDVSRSRKVQALEATEVRLLKEVDHRVKNIMAVVNSIVRLSRADDAALYAEGIQRRIQVLARAHDLLAEAEWRQVALHDVMRSLLGHLDRTRVAFSGDPVMISPDIVQPISLATHELADNAVRHGALSVPGGKLDVAWKGSVSNGGLELHWREWDGLHRPTESSRGFGAAIISGMIERQLRGQITREWTSDGLIVVVKLPSGISLPGHR